MYMSRYFGTFLFYWRMMTSCVLCGMVTSCLPVGTAVGEIRPYCSVASLPNSPSTALSYIHHYITHAFQFTCK